MISQDSKRQFVCKQTLSTKSQGREITRKRFPHHQNCFQGADFEGFLAGGLGWLAGGISEQRRWSPAPSGCQAAPTAASLPPAASPAPSSPRPARLGVPHTSVLREHYRGESARGCRGSRASRVRGAAFCRVGRLRFESQDPRARQT